MTPKELRIANYCQTDKGYLLQVNALSEKGIDFHLVDRKHYPVKETWQAEPIPLTEEWFIRFGFNKRSTSSCVWMLEMPDYEATLQIWSDNTYISICRSGIAAYHLKCEYVHQLQNLYFALTGEELNLKS